MSAKDTSTPCGRSAFFYGTLMAPQILYRVIWGKQSVSLVQRARLTIQPALLDDFCRRKVLYGDYPGIIQQAGHSVRGTYVTGLTDGEFVRLDYFEGSQYERKKVRVKVLAEKRDAQGMVDETKVEVLGEAVAETYVFLHESELEEGEWDFGEFTRKRIWWWIGASEEYEGLDEVEAESQSGNDEKSGINGVDPTGGRDIRGDMDAKLREI